MFQRNDVIIYGGQGVCKITGTEEKTVNGKKKTYFVLKPVGDNGATIFAPTDNAVVLGKMRRLLTKEEIHGLMDSMRTENMVWVDNENERKELYRNILSKGDHLELIKMLKAIYAHKKAREAEGKRLHMSDERFFKDAEQILYNEFQYVLNLGSKDELLGYILARIEKGVVDGYKKIEKGVVSGYSKIEDKFVDAYLTKDGETVEEAKARLKKEHK